MTSLKNKTNNKQTLGWIIKSSKRYIWAVVILTVLSASISLSAVALALVSKKVIDIATGNAQGDFLKSGLLLFAIVIFQIIISGINSILRVNVNSKLVIALRNRLFSKVSKRKYSELYEYHSGELVNRFTSDIDVVVSGCVNIVPSVVAMVSKIIGGISALLILDKRIALLILAFGITVPMLGRVINRRFKILHKQCQESEGKTRSFLQECFANIIVLKIFSSEASFAKKLGQYMKKNHQLKMKRAGISTVTHLSLHTFFTAGYYVVLLWGAGSIAKGAITYGTLNAFLQLVQQLRAPMQNVSGIMPQYYSMLASAERLIELENGDVDKAPDEEKISVIKKAFNSIEFKNIDFAYKDEAILSNCNFKVESGKITALTGESGSGKSTVLKLILGLYEAQNGTITINGDIPLDTSLRGIFAYVPQGNMILSGTVRENITLCNEKISEEELINVSKAACIYDIISELPDGFDTVLTERGGGLSEGQIQRISIARALLTDAPVLLFDEATSALDEATETELLNNIKVMKEKTVLFITHRNTSLKVCDKIIHVEDKVFKTIKE